MSPFSFTITLPSLSTEQAIALSEALHQLVDALWDVHGDAMAQVYAQEGLLDPDPHDWYDPAADPDDDVPF